MPGINKVLDKPLWVNVGISTRCVPPHKYLPKSQNENGLAIVSGTVHEAQDWLRDPSFVLLPRQERPDQRTLGSNWNMHGGS